MEGLEDEELISPDTHVVVVTSNKNIERYPFCLGDDPSHIVYNDPAHKTHSWSSIKGVTPTKLIEMITTIHFHDTAFIQDALLTYRDFITPTEFINLCLKRYEGPSEGSSTDQQRAIWEKDKNFVKSSMLIIIHKWLATLCKTDFLVSPTSTEPNNLIESVTTFINATPDSYHTEFFTLLFSAKKRQHSALNSSGSNANLSPSQNKSAPPGSVGGVTSGSTTMRFALNKPSSSSNNKTTSPNLTSHESSEPANGSFSPEHISNELTLIEHELIKTISPLEFSKQAWNKSQKEILAPNILAFTEWFNRTSRWICTKIVSKDHPTLRAMIVEGFIAIGIMCLELKNFNGVMVTLSALHNSAISRLKQTWAMVNPKTLADFQSLSSLLSPDKNFKAYRPLLKEAANSPCIPYLGLFLTDYTFMDELPVFLSEHEGLLNVERILMIGGKLKEFIGYQHHHYDIKSRESIRAAILSERVWDDNEIFNMSKLREDSNTSSSNGNNPSPNSQNTAIDANNLTSAYVTVRLKKGALNEMRMQLTGTDLPSSVRHILTNREWNLISTGSYEETYSNGDVIVNVGDISKNVFRVLSGVVKMERTSNKPIDGESAHIFTAVAQPGQAIGEMVLFSNHVSPVKITALGSVTLQVFHIPMIRKVLEFDSVLNATFYKAIAHSFAYRIVHQIGACVGQPTANNNAANSRLTSSLPTITTTTPPQISPLNLDEKLPLDIEFQSRFSLPDDEIPIKSYNTKTGSATGILYLSKHHICFYGTVFGVSKSKKYHYTHINQVAKTTDPATNELTSLVIVKEGTKKNSRKYVFKTPQELSQCYGIVFGLWKIHHKEFLPALPSSPGAKSLDADLPSKEDWAILLKGAKRSTYKQGEIIVNEGSDLQKLYVILKGECYVERSLNDIGEFISPFEAVNRLRSMSKGEGEDQSAVENNNLNSLTNYANRGARSMEALDLKKLKSAVSNLSNESGGRLLQRTESGFIPRGSQNNNINSSETHKILTRDNNSKREIVATIQEDEVFGIESFLLNYPAVGRLVAETDEVEVGALEISVINVLLSLKQQLASKFYKYLAITLYKRINHSISPPSNSGSRKNSIATPKLGSIAEMTPPLKSLSANLPDTLVMLEEEEMIIDGNQLVASTTLR